MTRIPGNYVPAGAWQTERGNSRLTREVAARVQQAAIDPDLHGIDMSELDASEVAWKLHYLRMHRNFTLLAWVAAAGWMLATGALIALVGKLSL